MPYNRTHARGKTRVDHEPPLAELPPHGVRVLPMTAERLAVIERRHADLQKRVDAAPTDSQLQQLLAASMVFLAHARERYIECQRDSDSQLVELRVS